MSFGDPKNGARLKRQEREYPQKQTLKNSLLTPGSMISRALRDRAAVRIQPTAMLGGPKLSRAYAHLGTISWTVLGGVKIRNLGVFPFNPLGGTLASAHAFMGLLPRLNGSVFTIVLFGAS